MNDIDHQIADLEAQLKTMNEAVLDANKKLEAAREVFQRAYNAADMVWHRIQVLKYQADRERQLPLAAATQIPAVACPRPVATLQPAADNPHADRSTAAGADFSPVTTNQSDPSTP